MDSITSITIPVDNFELQTFTSTDTNLIGNQEVEVVLNTNTDSVEYYLYDQNQQLLEEDYNFIGWQANADSTATNLPDTLKNVNLDPEEDVLNSLPSTGKYYPFYTFVRNKFLSSTNSRFYIDSISGDRKELTIKTNNLTPEQLTSLTEEFLAEVNSAQYFKEFYLNFGENQSIIGLDLRQEEDTLKIKLYLPLPTNFQTKSTFWIQFRVADPIAYEVDYLQILAPEDTTFKLRGPNLNIERKKDSPNSTEYKDKTQLDFTYSTGSRAQLSSLLQEKGIELNIDYTDYSNFIHFSSATQRLQNFYYKVQLIESGSNRINQITGSTMPAGQQSQSIAILQNEIDEIITNFDGYDYYLYYESGSKAWPKTNSTKPYTLASTGSAEVITWYGTEGLDGTGQLQSASIYDNGNQDNLVYSTPEFIREDSDNAAYDLFIEMIGQHFDNLYLYTEAITQKYNADNRLDFGVSKDLVADTLRSFGVKLYENNFSTDDLYTALIGLTPSGSTLPLPNISTNFPVTGSGIEYIETIVSASNEVIPLDDLNKSVYKRLYHNLPALVKKKGTLAGLRLLVNAFGIPDTILRINEFGGKDKNPNTWDYNQNEYDYAFNTSGSGFVDLKWDGEPVLNTDPGAVAAYSVRLLDSTYTGSLIRIRRSTDNEELDVYPDALGNLDTSSIDNFCGSGDGYVVKWYDQSGNNLPLQQTNDAYQPFIYFSGSVPIQNGKPTLYFNQSGYTQYLIGDSSLTPITTTSGSVFTAARMRTTNGGQTIWTLHTSHTSHFAWLKTNEILRKLGGVDLGKGTAMYDATNMKLSSVFFLDASTDSFVDGVENTTSKTGGAYAQSSKFWVGAVVGAGSAIQRGNMNISELILYNTDKSSTRIDIENSINYYYSIF